MPELRLVAEASHPFVGPQCADWEVAPARCPEGPAAYVKVRWRAWNPSWWPACSVNLEVKVDGARHWIAERQPCDGRERYTYIQLPCRPMRVTLCTWGEPATTWAAELAVELPDYFFVRRVSPPPWWLVPVLALVLISLLVAVIRRAAGV
jgi:hypothetical protein